MKIKLGAMARQRAQFLNCKECELYKTRTQVVIGRGVLPCRLLVIGEAPGENEDLEGVPFIGPSGRLLDRLFKDVGLEGKYFITNMLGCRPVDEQGNNRTPNAYELCSCKGRLDSLLVEAKASAILAVGNIARDWVGGWQTSRRPPNWHDLPLHSIYHPAFILRRGGYGTKSYKEWRDDLKKIVKQLHKEHVL